jgi:hypothetical protein
MMSSDNGFVWKIHETPGIYVIQTNSNSNIGSSSMTIRQNYSKESVVAETMILIRVYEI